MPLQLLLSDGSIYAEIGFVDGSAQSIDASTGTFTVEALFPNPEGILLPGQFARIRAPYSTIKDAIVVPKQAVVEFQGRFQVYVVNEANIVSLKNIQKGPSKGNEIVIESGLEAGEIVIVEGTQKVRPDMEVMPQPYIPPSDAIVLQDF